MMMAGQTVFSLSTPPPHKNNPGVVPAMGSAEEIDLFQQLQAQFCTQFKSAFPDKLVPKTVVVVPSLTLDQEILSKVKGAVHYEERLLCLLMLLRMPRTEVIYVSSTTLDPVVVDYYLHLLPGITGYHARQRLYLLSCYDASPRSLTEKILERPRLIRRIKESIKPGHVAHLACFNVTPLERSLAVQLGVPLFGCDPDLLSLGNKSNSRRIFKEKGLPLPAGFEDLYTKQDLADALAILKKQNPLLRKAVVKLNDGFSGEGNGIYLYDEPGVPDLKNSVAESLGSRLQLVADDLPVAEFLNKLQQMGGVAEEFIEGEIKESPSVQCRINPDGTYEVVSTHDQQLGGESGQVFLGAYFPACSRYAGAIGQMGGKVAEALQQRGVLGRFAVDFISVQTGDNWQHYAIEINLRKGGTTHPLLMLQFLTDGHYNVENGLYCTASGQPRYYFCSDNLKQDRYKGLTPHDLIDIAMTHGLHYDGTLQEGVMFHMIGALSQYGKLGVICIAHSPGQAKNYYNNIVDVLNRETA